MNCTNVPNRRDRSFRTTFAAIGATLLGSVLLAALGGCSQGMMANSAFGTGGGPTGTGVFVNGVEASSFEVAMLSMKVGYVPPGRWWLDAYGNYGPEGGGMMGNLNQQGGGYDSGGGGGGGGGGEGVLSSWDRTGVAVNAGGVLIK